MSPLTSLGALHHEIGDSIAADRCYREAEEIAKRRPDTKPSEMVRYINNLAMLRFDLGDYAVALDMYVLALNILREHSDDLTQLFVLNNAGICLIEKRDYPRACEMLRDAVKMWDVVVASTEGGENSRNKRQKALAMANLASALLQSDEREEALQVANAAIELVQNEAAGDSAAIMTRVTCAFVLALMGELRSAKAVATKALQLTTDLPAVNPLQHERVLSVLSGISMLDGNIESAIAYCAKAVANFEAVRRDAFQILSEQQRLALAMLLQDRVRDYLSLVCSRRPSPSKTDIRQSFNVLLRNSAIASEAVIVQRRAALAASSPLKERYQQLMQQRRSIAHRLLETYRRPGSTADYSSLAELATQSERLEQELARHIPELSLDLQMRKVCAAEVSARLPTGSALITYCCVPTFMRKDLETDIELRLVAYILPKNESDSVSLLDIGTYGVAVSLISELRHSIAGAELRNLVHPTSSAQDSLEIVRRLGRRVRSLVFDPIEAVLRREVKHLIICPDGSLSGLPFEILATDGEDYLIDRYLFSYLDCGRYLLRQKNDPHCCAPPVVMASPDFDLCTNHQAGEQTPQQSSRLSRSDLQRIVGRFVSLSGMQAEGKQIAAMLGVRPIIGKEARVERIFELHSPRILHLATHGFFIAQEEPAPPSTQPLSLLTTEGTNDGNYTSWLHGVPNPLLRSGLALAGANTWLRCEESALAATTGLLTADDVTTLDLSETELVVLSACDTGLGEALLGEGVQGLRRSFTLAGAQTVVASLWKVADEPTKHLMESYYRHLLDGWPRAEALRQSQLMLRNSEPHPGVWGAFVCVGNPAPLSTAV